MFAIASCTRVHDTRDVVRRDDTRHAAVLRDDYGDSIDVGRRPTRVVSLNPTTTEIIFAIGASSRLVGRSQWDAWPDSARFIPNLGNALRPNVEAILAAHPDLVILYASLDNRPSAERLRAAGVATLSLKIDQIREFDRGARLIGRILGDSARGAYLADTVAATLARVRAATRSLPHPTVVWPFSYPMVVGGGSYMSELIEIAGGQNIYASLPQPSPVVTVEDVVRRNPQYVIRSIDDVQSVTQPELSAGPWRAVPAVREGRVLSANAALAARPSVKLGQAAVELARVLHPGIALR